MLKIKANTAQGYIELESGGILDISYPTSSTRRGRVQGRGGQICPALTATGSELLILYEELD